MLHKLIVAVAAAAAAFVTAMPANGAALIQSYTATTTFDVSNIVTYNTYANGSGTSNSYSYSYSLPTPGGTFTDIFPKDSANPPLTTYFLGTATYPPVADAFSISVVAEADHLVLALDPVFATALLLAGEDFSVSFAGFDENSLIDALQLLATSDLPAGDPGLAAQLAAKEAAFSLIDSFSSDVDGKGGLVAADGGLFSLLSFSRPTAIGSGIAQLTPQASPAGVPEPAAWAMMILGFGIVGAAARRGGGRTARA